MKELVIRMRLPDDSRLILEQERVVGVETRHGSFDYTQEGQAFLGLPNDIIVKDERQTDNESL